MDSAQAKQPLKHGRAGVTPQLAEEGKKEKENPAGCRDSSIPTEPKRFALGDCSALTLKELYPTAQD